MKSILTLALLLVGLTAYSQPEKVFSYKDLGLGRASFSNSSLQGKQSVASPRDLLNLDPRHKAMVQEFAEHFPGQDSLVLTSSLLDTFAATRKKAAGVNLSLGSEKGKLQVLITHTSIDTLKVNDTFDHGDDAIKYDAASNYTAMYDRAYYWDKQKQNWQLVKNKGKLKQSVLTSRRQAQEQYGYGIQGYYLSKDLLLNILRESGQKSLTVFLGQEDGIFHLIIPIVSKTATARPVFHFATNYKLGIISHYKTNLPPDATSVPYYTTSRSDNISILPPNVTSPVSQAPPPPKDHNTIRPCPPYCSN